jgi:uncharacterized protein
MSADAREFQVFVKPVGGRCNLSCSYCYYNKTTVGSATGMMDEKILEKYIRQHFEAASGPVVFFSWHGGEPLLAGIEFYKNALRYQNMYKPDSTTVLNGIQTNGTLLDDSWCRFFSDAGFYVGISIDGPREFHDKFRTSKNGIPSFQKVEDGYKRLCDHGMHTEILCVVSSVNARFPGEVYGYIKNLGAQFITFIPLVVRGKNADEIVDDISVPPIEFGKFLCSVFDEWVANDVGRIKIQIIEESLRVAFNQDHTLCIFKKKCGGVPAIELNGDFYSCDHFTDMEHLVGNINDFSLAEMLDSRKQVAFGALKEESLPRYCIDCEVREMCNGECPKNRFMMSPEGEPGLNYLCPGYRLFFNHVRPFAESVKAEWLRRKGDFS